jgi:hypothetical protein
MSQTNNKPGYITIALFTVISVAIAALIGTFVQQLMFGKSNISVTVAIAVMVGFGISRTMWEERERKRSTE